MKWLKRIYYRLRVKRRLQEIKTGKRRSRTLLDVDPVTLDDMISEYGLNY